MNIYSGRIKELRKAMKQEGISYYMDRRSLLDTGHSADKRVRHSAYEDDGTGRARHSDLAL
jgi:hypothetical protein